jgi:uncharacterized protein (UPF0264 family)
MKKHRTYLVFALVAAVACLRATPVAAQAGPEQTQQFLKAVEGTVKAIGESRAQLQKTVATYNSITEMTAKDLKSAYKDLGKDVADSEKKVADGRPKVDEMNSAVEGYFAASRAHFEKIAVAGKDARLSYDTLMKDVKDQYTFLGHDLNASAIASLKPDAAKFNARASTVFAKVDGVTKMFDGYMASMKP